MRSAAFMFILALVVCLAPLAPASAAGKPSSKIAPARPTITVRATACVSDAYFTLGEIADIKGGDASFAARLAAAPMGMSPLAGLSRTLTTGEISLKLRQAGIDPAAVALAGASCVLVTGSGDSSPTASSGSSAPNSASPAQNKAVIVHSGDAVNLVYIDGRISISARAYALQNGAAGDTIMLRRDDATHTFQGTVLDSQTVQLED